MEPLMKSVFDALNEIRTVSRQIGEQNARETMLKYDMMFLGENFNVIYCEDLRRLLERNLGTQLSFDELSGIIPDVCASLNMKFESLVAVEDLDKTDRKTKDYKITLY